LDLGPGLAPVAAAVERGGLHADVHLARIGRRHRDLPDGLAADAGRLPGTAAIVRAVHARVAAGEHAPAHLAQRPDALPREPVRRLGLPGRPDHDHTLAGTDQ